MCTQLAVPENDLVSQATYNQLFTMHGSTMMFLFAVPVVEMSYSSYGFVSRSMVKGCGRDLSITSPWRSTINTCMQWRPAGTS
ncbi:MAG: hypothetical protein IT532_14485 [Burkholderiales bacterium]|nr:hypothetical protein [Burkholderiales bacterium]